MKVENILLITGSAPNVLEDIEAALLLLQPSAYSLQPDFMSIGLSSIDKHLHHIKYMATYHPAEIAEIKQRREAAGGNTDYLVISHEKKDGVDIFEPQPAGASGSSSHLGTMAAIRFGYKKIILCGCPLTGDSTTRKGNRYEVYRKGWQNNFDFIKNYVRSMSGWTRELLGEPTAEWIDQI